MTKLFLDLAENSYHIHIAAGIIKQTNKIISELNLGKQLFIICDSNVAKLHYATLHAALKDSDHEIIKIELDPGEQLKSFLNLTKICNQILKYKPNRNSTIIALGGGVIGDLSGFAASIILRGINYIQIPTTLLSQVDSSVGGKTGINTNAGKNLIGSFYQPRAVLIDPEFILSLSEREYYAGYVECFKYALINQKDFFDYLEQHKELIKKRDLNCLTEIIARSCQSKADIVALDEKEQSGSRALLNLGHTFGHALEQDTGYSENLKHGEAVALGIILAAEFSTKLGFMQHSEIHKIEEHFKYFSIKTRLEELDHLFNKDNLFNAVKGDKKNIDNQLVFILLNQIGSAFVSRNVSENSLLDFLDSLF